MTKKAAVGSDFSQPATGYSDKSDGDEPRDPSIYSVSEAMVKLNKELETNGYLLLPEIGGAFCGFSVYRREHKIDIKGISPSDRFWYWRKIQPGKEGLSFTKTVKECCEDFISQGAKGEYNVWKTIALNFLDKAADSKCEVARIAQGYYSTLVRENTTRTATLNGTPGHFKVIPLLSWFPEKLQQFDARKLLTLLPDAEANQLMLILGRAVVGANGIQVAEGLIEHTFRSFAIVIGTEAGMGKSTMMAYIIKTMETLGYSVSNAPINETKFGWGTIAQSDLAFVDDLVDDVQRRLISDVKVKSIVSNNTLKVEEKSQPAVDVRSTTVLICNANLHNPSHYIGMDSGSISRCNQLDTYTNNELKKAYPGVPDARIKPFWEATARHFGVSTECLAAYLLRRCADYFLDVCGYTWDDGRLFKESEDRLEYVIKDNRNRFRIDTTLRHAEELPKSTAHLVALAIADVAEHKRESYMDLLEHLDFSPSLLLAVMRLFSTIRKNSPLPECYKDLDLHHASWDCKDFINKKLGDLDRLATVKSSEDAFRTTITELKSNKGFGYPTKSAHYVPEWQTQKRLIPDYIEKYSEAVKVTPLPKNLQVAVSEVQKIFTELQ